MARDKRMNDDLDRPPDEGFLGRWSRRKRCSPFDEDAADGSPSRDLETAQPADVRLPSGMDDRDAIEDETDADMPPIESLDENSDYSRFMSPKVSTGLRRLALRKLFHQSKFNVRDKLDCHARDFTKFEPLGDKITADMRHQTERAARDGPDDDNSDEPAIDGQTGDQDRDEQFGGAARETTTEPPDEDCDDQ